MDSILQDIPNHILCVPKERLHGFGAQFRSKRRRTAENISHQVWPQVICLTGCIQRHKNHISFLLSAMSRGQAEGRGQAQTYLCCSRTALDEDCTEKDPKVWEDSGLVQVISCQLSPLLYKLWGGGCPKASNKLTQPHCTFLWSTCIAFAQPTVPETSTL